MRSAWSTLFIATLCVAIAGAAMAAAGKAGKNVSSKPGFVLENTFVKYVVDADGFNANFFDKTAGKEYNKAEVKAKFAQVSKGGKIYPCSRVSSSNGRIALDFGEANVKAIIKAESKKHYLTLEVASVTGEGVDELLFGYVELSLWGVPTEPFAASTLALNLQTNSPEIPGMNSRLRAICYPRFGFVGAKAAIVASPMAHFRGIFQEVIAASKDLPYNAIGGPWAMDAEINRGSYLFNFDGITEANVDQWIEVVKLLGINQIDFHGGSSFRFGDCRPNPNLYPNGRVSLKAVIDKLHDAGIYAGLQQRHPGSRDRQGKG